jgi:hypothetical protein
MERSKIRRVSPDFSEKSPVIEMIEAADGTSSLVVGSSNLYDENGEIRLIPAPSPDPQGTEQ